MNLLLLDQFSEMGGAQRCLLDLIPAFRERGWRISAAMPGGGPMFERMASMDVSVTRLPCRPYSSGSKTLGTSGASLPTCRTRRASSGNSSRNAPST